MSDDMVLTADTLERMKTRNGGYTRATIEALGLTWPLVGGWRKRVVGRRYPSDVIDRLVTWNDHGPATVVNPSVTTPKVEGVLHFDGSCWPNPGPDSRCGFVLHVGSRITERKIDLGAGTCNTAEYHGIINGMRSAIEAGVTHLEVYGDSQLVINGVSRMKPWAKGKPHLEALKAEAQALARQFAHVEFHWVPRTQNADADALTR